MNKDAPSSVSIQTSAELLPAMPAWFGEVALIAHTLTRQGLLSQISEQVRFSRKRFGTFEVIDFVVVLMGYAISGAVLQKRTGEHDGREITLPVQLRRLLQTGW